MFINEFKLDNARKSKKINLIKKNRDIKFNVSNIDKIKSIYIGKKIDSKKVIINKF